MRPLADKANSGFLCPPADRQPEHRAVVRQLHALQRDLDKTVLPLIGAPCRFLRLRVIRPGPLPRDKMQRVGRARLRGGQVRIILRGRAGSHIAQAFQPLSFKVRQFLLKRERKDKLLQRAHAVGGVEQRLCVRGSNRIRTVVPHPLHGGKVVIPLPVGKPDGNQRRMIRHIGYHRDLVGIRPFARTRLPVRIAVRQIAQQQFLFIFVLCICLPVKRDRAAAHCLRSLTHFTILGCDLRIRRVVLHVGGKRQIIGQAVVLRQLHARHRMAADPVLAEGILQISSRFDAQCHDRTPHKRVGKLAGRCVFHAEPDVFLHLLQIAPVDKALRQGEGIAVGVVVVGGRGDGVVGLACRAHSCQPIDERGGILLFNTGNMCAAISDRHAAVNIIRRCRTQVFSRDMLRCIQVYSAASFLQNFKADAALLCFFFGVLQRSVRADNCIAQRAVYRQYLAPGRLEFDDLPSLHQRDLTVCVFDCLRDRRADRQFSIADQTVVFDEICTEAIVELSGEPYRQPVIAGFLHLYVHGRAAVGEAQPHNGSGIVLLNQRGGEKRPASYIMRIAFRVFICFMEKAENCFCSRERLLQIFDRLTVVGIGHNFPAVAVFHIRPGQAGTIQQPEQLALRLGDAFPADLGEDISQAAVIFELRQPCDGNAAVFLSNRNIGCCAAVSHTAAVHLEHRDAGVLILARHNHIITERGRRGPVFGIPDRIFIFHLFLGISGQIQHLPNQALLFFPGQHRIQRPHGLIRHRARILLRKVGGSAVVLTVSVGVVLRLACRHDDTQLFASCKRVLHLVQIVFTIVGHIPAADNLRAAAPQMQDLHRPFSGVAAELRVFPVDIGRVIRQAEVVFVQHTEGFQTIHRVNLHMQRLHAVYQHLAIRLFERKPDRVPQRYAVRKAFCGKALRRGVFFPHHQAGLHIRLIVHRIPDDRPIAAVNCPWVKILCVQMILRLCLISQARFLY